MTSVLTVSDIADLILLCSRNSLSSTTITEGLQLIVKILELSDACPQDHLTVLCSQVQKKWGENYNSY